MPSLNNFKYLFQISHSHTIGSKLKKGTSRQRSGKGAIRKRFPLQKPRWEKTKPTTRYLYHETIASRMGSYFPNRWPLSHPNLTKNMKTHIRRQQHKKSSNTKTQNKKNHHRSIDLERSVKKLLIFLTL